MSKIDPSVLASLQIALQTVGETVGEAATIEGIPPAAHHSLRIASMLIEEVAEEIQNELEGKDD